MTTLFRRMERKSRIPLGCDQQGRYLQAAEAAGAFEDDDDTRPIPGAGPVVWLFWALMAMLATALAVHVAMRVFS